MAFDSQQSSFGKTLFHTYQRQAGVNMDGENTGTMALPFVSIPGASLQEQDSASYVPWSCSTHEDPYELFSCTQTSNKIRKLTDNADCDGETDLHGLVSNILDEADSQDKGSLPTCNPIWSPKTMREELLKNFQSEAKAQHHPSFPSNYVSHETFGKAQHQSVDRGVEEINQQPGGFATNKQWHFNLPDGGSYSHRSQKLPPGLPLPNTRNTYPTQIQESKYVSMLAYNDRAINNFPDLSDFFRPQSEMNSRRFDPFHEEPMCNEQYVPEDINQLVSGFQSFMASEQDSACRGDFPNMHKQTVGMHHEDSMAEQWKISSPAMSTQSTPAMQISKQLLGGFGTVQRGRNGVRKQTFKHNAFQDLPDFNTQNTEYFQLPKPFSAPLNFSNQYQNKMTMHRENMDGNLNQYSKHHIQQTQIQNRIKSQMQKEKRRMHMSGCQGEGFSRRPQANTHLRGGDKQLFSQNQYFDFQGSMPSQRFDGEGSVVSTGNIQQFVPFMYPVNDFRRQSSMPINANFSSRSTPAYGSGVPGLDAGNVSANGSAAFKSFPSDMRTRGGETAHYGLASAMTTSMLMNQDGPVVHLYFYLDECYKQWRCLERERKKMEVILTKTFFGKRAAAVTNSNLPKTPPNPTRTDHLIVNQMREQAKVASLLDRMEYLCCLPLHTNIHTALSRHHMAICLAQAKCKEDTANMTKHQRPHFTEDRDAYLVVALSDLAAATRRLRTAVWCALQMILPQPDKTHDHNGNDEATRRERCTSPLEGYGFKI